MHCVIDDQIDDVAMGSHPASVLANSFLGHLERLWPNMYKGSPVHL